MGDQGYLKIEGLSPADFHLQKFLPPDKRAWAQHLPVDGDRKKTWQADVPLQYSPEHPPYHIQAFSKAGPVCAHVGLNTLVMTKGEKAVCEDSPIELKDGAEELPVGGIQQEEPLDESIVKVFRTAKGPAVDSGFNWTSPNPAWKRDFRLDLLSQVNDWLHQKCPDLDSRLKGLDGKQELDRELYTLYARLKTIQEEQIETANPYSDIFEKIATLADRKCSDQARQLLLLLNAAFFYGPCAANFHASLCKFLLEHSTSGDLPVGPMGLCELTKEVARRLRHLDTAKTTSRLEFGTNTLAAQVGLGFSPVPYGNYNCVLFLLGDTPVLRIPTPTIDATGYEGRWFKRIRSKVSPIVVQSASIHPSLLLLKEYLEEASLPAHLLVNLQARPRQMLNNQQKRCEAIENESGSSLCVVGQDNDSNKFYHKGTLPESFKDFVEDFIVDIKKKDGSYFIPPSIRDSKETVQAFLNAHRKVLEEGHQVLFDGKWPLSESETEQRQYLTALRDLAHIGVLPFLLEASGAGSLSVGCTDVADRSMKQMMALAYLLMIVQDLDRDREALIWWIQQVTITPIPAKDRAMNGHRLTQLLRLIGLFDRPEVKAKIKNGAFTFLTKLTEKGMVLRLPIITQGLENPYQGTQKESES